MRLIARLAMTAAALATPIWIAAQAPPAPGPDNQGPGPGMGMQRRMGPGGDRQMGPGMGMRGQRGMKMRQGRGMMGRRPGMEMNRFLQDPAIRERLKITPEQVTRFQEQQSAISKAMIRSRADIQVKRMELNELLRTENPDRALIDRKLREVQDAQFAAEKTGIDNRLAMHGLFTAEQRQEMEKIRSEFRGRRMQRGPEGPGEGGRFGPRGPHRMGPQQQPTQPPPPPADDGL